MLLSFELDFTLRPYCLGEIAGRKPRLHLTLPSSPAALEERGGNAYGQGLRKECHG